MYMGTTSISSKGQLVIPQNVRKQLRIKEGDNFVVQAHNGAIVLRKLPAELPAHVKKTLAMLDKAYKDLEAGKFKSMPKEDFLREIRKW
jgi:AbrB family looped-hinge helix DNA binding protein